MNWKVEEASAAAAGDMTTGDDHIHSPGSARCTGIFKLHQARTVDTGLFLLSSYP